MILITGASGLLGANLVSLAQEQGRDVVGLYHRHPVNLPRQAMLKADLTEESEIHRIFKELKPTSVIHCAAETNVDWCQEHPEEAHRINVSVSASIAEVAARTRTRLLYVSTDSVFDGVRGHYSETDKPSPLNVYAQTKLSGEQAVLGGNPLTTVARITLYGWNAQNKQSLAEWILGHLILGNAVPGFIDSVFCPIFANDLAQVLLEMLDGDFAGLYHVVGSEPVSKYEFAKRVAKRFGFDPNRVVPTRITDSELTAARPRNTSLNTEKICAALGRHMPDVDSGLRKFAQLQPEGQAERLKSHLTGARE